MATFDEFIGSITAEKNDGKAFELFCKHFLETSPEYVDQFEEVWLWDDWPLRWEKDKGVDLVAKYKGRNKFCAIQAKCYAADNTVSYGDVTNFLADSNRAEIEDRILMMSTDRLSERTSRETIKAQEKPVVIRDRHYFENIPYDFPKNISEIKKAKPRVKKKEPRDYQRDAIDDVVSRFSSHDRGQLIMACGTGKTVTTLWIKEELKCKNTLVLLPSLSLLSQTMLDWIWEANEKFETLAVCSDPTVGRSRDEADSDISAAEVGKVSWQVDDIKSFLTKPNSKVIFCTYQSSKLIMEAQTDKKMPTFDLVICDEAHRCAGSGVQGAAFSTVLFEDKIRAKKRLFTTATPRIFGQTSKADRSERGVDVFSMDDQEVFGPVFHKLSFGQAIKINRLTDYQVVVVGVDEPTVYDWIFNREVLVDDTNKRMDAKSLASKVAVLKAIKDYDLKKLISFHNSVRAAKFFSNEVERINDLIDEREKPQGKIWSSHVDGTMSAFKRRNIINFLRNPIDYDIGLITNARCLSEGIDVPSLDGIAFVEPRSSRIDIIQSVGRAIRKSENKKKGTIILPVFLAEGDDPDAIIDGTNFKPVWEVLKALKAHDDLLDNQLDKLRTNLGSDKGRVSDRIDKVIFDFPRNVPMDFASKLTTRLVEAVTVTWWFWYGLLEKYTAENNGAIPLADYKTPSGDKLGRWCIKQRTLRYSMPKERLEHLEKIPSWVWDVADAEWDAKYNKVLAYRTLNGSPFSRKQNPDKNVKAWVTRQRNSYFSGELSQERISLLEKIPSWAWNSEGMWENQFNAFSKVVDKEGTSLLTVDFVAANGDQIGTWIDTQRQNKDDLSKEQISKLENLPDWSWHPNKDRWFVGFKYLKEYCDANGTSLVLQSYKTFDGYPLGTWLNTQRRSFQKLDEEFQSLLRNLPDWCIDAREYNWQKTFELFENFAQGLDNPNISRATKGPFPDINIGQWVETQKERHRSNRLEKNKLQKLEKIKGWTWRV